ncbi:30S ribosomal protein S15 [candidate division WWE3 bacterium RIFCSPLOWO2_01_FULL_42_11]|uniref:Small ribosomal subunit protein uS15 n=1 Tax=candidate division WWE3 bacterium RIFCSPLOWO2_01_FULL_42_11 TaxID=1802627 RepID=A0A1F4VP52_UNCKA|nr:MAG: 30S ribosomal protein S15 [candidate division WWE3 bacterium RIFCSPLOWO2_01_FULL_42_11]
MALAKEKKQSIIVEYAQSEKDTGSPEVQVAILSTRIAELQKHLREHKNDIHSRRGLLMLVNKRRRILAYLQRVDETRYKSVIKKVGLSK